MPKKGEPPRAYSVPVAPFRRIVNAWIDRALGEWGQSGEQLRDTDPIHPTTRLCRMIWPKSTVHAAKRRLYALQYEQNTIDFDTADRILCALEMNDLWITDPELNEIYETVPLPALDISRPTCEAAAESSREALQELVDSIGIGQAARTIGVSDVTIHRALAKAAACA